MHGDFKIIPLTDRSRGAPNGRRQLINRSCHMKRTTEQIGYWINSPIIDLDFVAALDCRLRTIAQRWRTDEYSGIVFSAGDAPFKQKQKILESFVRIPEQARSTITFNGPIREPAKSARPRHAPAIKIREQRTRLT